MKKTILLILVCAVVVALVIPSEALFQKTTIINGVEITAKEFDMGDPNADIAVSFEVTEAGGGNNQSFKIMVYNNSDKPISGWTLSFGYDGEISNMLNAASSHTGGVYTIAPLNANKDNNTIAAGGWIELNGKQKTEGTALSDVKFNGYPVMWSFKGYEAPKRTMSDIEVIEWLSSQLADPTSTAYEYFNPRAPKNSLDSTGKNWAPEIKADMEAAGFNTEKAFSYRIYKNGQGDYNIFWVNVNVANMNVNDTLDYVLMYNTVEKTVHIGTSKVISKSVDSTTKINIISGGDFVEAIPEVTVEEPVTDPVTPPDTDIEQTDPETDPEGGNLPETDPEGTNPEGENEGEQSEEQDGTGGNENNTEEPQSGSGGEAQPDPSQPNGEGGETVTP